MSAIASILGSSRSVFVPSESAIATPTRLTPVTQAAPAAASAASHETGPLAPAISTSGRKISRATHELSENWARLNATLSGRWRRKARSAREAPAS